MLSISVGILNLLPFPPLDGGQMSIALAEMLRGGRRLSLQVQSLVITMGMAFVMLLMVSALWLDFREKTHETSHQPLVPKTSPPPPAHATGKIP
jgi:regulator of sigma E protease